MNVFSVRKVFLLHGIFTLICFPYAFFPSVHWEVFLSMCRGGILGAYPTIRGSSFLVNEKLPLMAAKENAEKPDGVESGECRECWGVGKAAG